MSDNFERQLRQHLAYEAAQVQHFPRPLASRIEAAVESRGHQGTLRQVALAAGLVILAVLLAVGLSQARSSRSQPAGVAGPWEEDLTFSGAVTGNVRSTVAGDAEGVSTCIGKYAKPGEGWAANLVVEVAGTPYRLEMLVLPYRDPGTYSNTTGSRTVFIWLQGPRGDLGTSWGDDRVAATVTLNPGNESGTVEATLTGHRGPADVVRVSGRWTCRTRT